MSTVTGRTRHYGSFYRLSDDPYQGSPSSPGPNILVYGNCQAEALRILLASSTLSPVRTMRIPPVFELEPSDLPFLRLAAADAQVLVAQPVGDGYRNLPLGTAQVAAMMPSGSAVIRWPVVRHAGLHPWQAIVRDPTDPSRNPPVVPYHDLRTLAGAKVGQDRHLVPPSSAAIMALDEESTAELRRRENRDCDVSVSDLFERPEPGDMKTINHPGNRILLELGRRVQQAMGSSPDVTDPGRTLLGEVVTPLEASVADALGLPSPTREAWQISGRAVPASTIRQAQTRWYADHPAVLEAGWDRYRATIELLGLS